MRRCILACLLFCLLAASALADRAPSLAPTAAPANNQMDWQVAYRNYIRLSADAWQMANESEATFTLIYVNSDAIPELVINAGYEAAGCLILTYDGQKVDALQTARLGFRFIQGGNALNNSDGNMGVYYDHVYAIQNGRWVMLGEGSYESMNADWDSYGRCLDENAAYTWNGVRASRAGYYAGLSQIFDATRAYEAAGYTRSLAALIGN